MRQRGFVSSLNVVLVASIVGLAGCGDKPAVVVSQQTKTGVTLLNQGWNDQQREAAWYTSFGSRIVPVSWFVALEEAASEARFSRPQNLQRLGFMVAGRSPLNPHGLPIGMAATPAADGESWLGLGCSGCHSGQVFFQGNTLHIDGGQAQIDFQLFEAELLAALKATLTDTDKWQRFVRAVQAPDNQNIDAEALRLALAQRIESLSRTAALNATEYAYGRGRLDAFGQIFNAVAADFLNIPENRREPNAPTSYPVLWGASHLDVVQWNGSAPNAGPGPLVQNATTGLAVFGELNIHRGGLGYGSSIAIENLGMIQDLWYDLSAPVWPEQTLGPINQLLAEQGSTIYQRECVSCHTLAQQGDAAELKATLVDVKTVGTDPTMATNFVNAKVKTGAFEGEKLMVLAGPVLGEEAYAIEVVVHAAIGALLERPWQSFKAGLNGFHTVFKAPLHQRPWVYKARPLSGIWASAPYLHNGSVPTLSALLSAQRPQQFKVGKVEFDPVAVGLSTTVLDTAQVSDFNTQAPGNANTGHLYGTGLGASEKNALLEYLKTL